MLLLIDNYDSFTYNLVQYFGELGTETKVIRNDKAEIATLQKLQPSKIVISPGPCTPKEAGISNQAIEAFMGVIPILGVCLGHQCIAHVLGGEIVIADKIMHGKTSLIHHHNNDIFSKIPSPFSATRYHSLVIKRETLPKELRITAWTEDEMGNIEEIMGIKHRELPVFGMQFHPESILTEHGKDLLRNFLQIA